MHELRELLRELWSVRRRLLPVVLGLSWGTIGLSVLIAFGDGFDSAMRGALAQSGDHMLRFYAGATTRPFAGLAAGRAVRLLPEESATLAAVPGIVATSPEFTNTARALGPGGRSVNVNVCGVGSDYAAIRGMRVRPGGRFLSPVDVSERRRVVYLGYELAARLFGGTDVVGRTVSLWDTPFTVVGVMDERTTLMNYNGLDELKAIVPWTVVRSMRGLRQVTYQLARLDDGGAARAIEAACRRALSRRLRFDPDDSAAIQCSNHATESAEISAIVTGTRLFLFLVGALGLLVAALGVANMMFVLVEERVPEIGLRLALGARPAQIRRRQLLETLAVIAVGGGGGLLGAALLLLLANHLPLPREAKAYLGEPLLSVAAALGIAGMLGIAAGIAGWQPAARAAAVQPVEALRHE